MGDRVLKAGRLIGGALFIALLTLGALQILHIYPQTAVNAEEKGASQATAEHSDVGTRAIGRGGPKSEAPTANPNAGPASTPAPIAISVAESAPVSPPSHANNDLEFPRSDSLIVAVQLERIAADGVARTVSQETERFAEGDFFRLVVTANQPGKAYVIYDNPDGTLLRVYPAVGNKHEEDRVLTAGQSLHVPDLGEEPPYFVITDKNKGSERFHLYFTTKSNAIPEFVRAPSTPSAGERFSKELVALRGIARGGPPQLAAAKTGVGPIYLEPVKPGVLAHTFVLKRND